MTAFQNKQPLDFNTQFALSLDEDDDAIIIDLFAGGGGASTGLEIGLGRKVAVAINHNPKAISMHTVNHPHAKHYPTDVWGVCPLVASMGRVVGWLHASPDCRHFSQAKGGQARKEEIRDLSWVVIKYAGKLRKRRLGPWVVSLENVKQIQQWGPLVAKRDKDTGRVVTLDLVPDPSNPKRSINRVAEPGERVPVSNQFLVPDSGEITGSAARRRKRRLKFQRHGQPKGRTWMHFLDALRGLGYNVNHWVERNCDYGDPTTRERLYMVATADGMEPVLPEKTHAAKPSKGQKPHRTAAECLDFSDLGTSIFERKKPLVQKTLQRLAKGVVREVVEKAQPFMVPATHAGDTRIYSVDGQFPTITAAQRGELMMASPVLAPFLTEHANGSRQRVMPADASIPTICAQVKGGHFSLVAPVLVQCNGGKNTTAAHSVRKAVSTITTAGSQQQLAAAHLVHFRGNCDARPLPEPLRTLSAGGMHHGLAVSDLIQGPLSDEHIKGAKRVAEFLIRYHYTGWHGGSIEAYLETISTDELLTLVTVWIDGTPWLIVDLRMRMLRPRELYLAQGFPHSYNITHGHDGEKFTITEQTHMCGNSVSPGTMAAFARSNDPWVWRQRRREQLSSQEAA